MRNKTRVLITGGAGFIGSYLAEELLKRGERVSVIDDLSTGSKRNIANIQSHRNFSFIKGSILDEKLMKKLISQTEVIYHLAAAVGVKFVIDNPVKSIEINVNGTEILLRLASLRKQKVFLSSSSEVYGKTENGLFREDSDRLVGATTVGRWSYSCSKALDEFLCLAYHREKKLPVVIARLFNTCGARQTGKYGMVIPRFIKQALSNKPITIYGDGKQTRSFCHVKDTVRAIIELTMEPRAVGGIFNIGTDEAITIGELAKRVIKLTGTASKLLHIPYEKAYRKDFEDMRHRVPDTGKLEKLIGFTPRYNLDMILREVTEYFRKEK